MSQVFFFLTKPSTVMVQGRVLKLFARSAGSYLSVENS